MGGFFGEVTGKSKLATWKAYLKEVGTLASKQGQEEQGMFVDFPANKKDAYARMRPVDGGGWSLYYHFHS